MPRHKLKPNLNLSEDMEELIQSVSAFFGEPYDDRLNCSYDHISLRQVAKEFNITVLKARKILITADCYSISQSRLVNKLYDDGFDIPEIVQKTGLSRASVQSYLPYSKTIYNMKQKSVGADRIQRWREKNK